MTEPPLIYDVAEPLRFPKICTRCGATTHHLVTLEPVTPSEGRTYAAIGCLSLIFPVLNIVSAAQQAAQRHVTVPLCLKCHFNRFLPDRRILTFGVLLVSALAMAFLEASKAQYQNMFLALGAMLVCLIAALRVDRSKASDTLPVQVMRRKQGLRYIIFGGPLHECLMQMNENEERPNNHVDTYS